VIRFTRTSRLPGIRIEIMATPATAAFVVAGFQFSAFWPVAPSRQLPEIVAFRVPAQNGRRSWLTRAAYATGPLLCVLKTNSKGETFMTASIPLNKLNTRKGDPS
jgi:hypothetical protein